MSNEHAAEHAMIGKELGNYVVRALLGEGGMGAVFRGEHKFLGTKCAIKVLHGTFANNQAVTQRFFQEAKSSVEIGHANIVRILDFGQTGAGELYLVMELLEGNSLAGALRSNGTFGEGATARIGASIADGLAAAHEKGVIHRDLKPDNVFLTDKGDVKVLDFGIAKVAQSGAGTKTGSLLGTPQYMAPEQAKGSKHVGPHTDVYALGAILFEMMTGQPPFQGEEVAELLAKQLFEEPPRPSTLCAISEEMEALILSCLAKKPDERPKSMVELRERLQARVGASPSSGARPIAPPPARTPSQPGTSSQPGASQPGASSQPGLHSARTVASAPGTSTSPGTKTTLSGSTGQMADEMVPARSGSGAKVAIAAAVVVVLGAGGWLALRGSTPSPPPVAASQPKVDPKPAPPPPAPAPAAAAPAKKSDEPVKVVVRSDPPGAKVTVDGKEVGTTPALLTITLPQEVNLALDGYRPTHEVIMQPGETVVKLVAAKAPKKATVAKPAAAKPAATKPAPAHGEGLD